MMLEGFQWPAAQRFVDRAEAQTAASALARPFRDRCGELRLGFDPSVALRELYLPFAGWVLRARDRFAPGRALVLGLCGAQGSGKSTVAELLRLVLELGFGKRVALLSIDDLYRTREERLGLARTVHPLFRTRGVPLTHDVALGLEVLGALRGGPGGRRGQATKVALPRFDKSRDTRVPRDEWGEIALPVDVVVFEGWCVGARPWRAGFGPDPRLPVNRLEREEDPDGRWRAASETALAGEYQALFSLLDVLVLLAVDGMERVFEWRRLQERKLRAAVQSSGRDPEHLAVMSDAEVERFVMHYERLTRRILAEMPSRADLVFRLDVSHGPRALEVNRPV